MGTVVASSGSFFRYRSTELRLIRQRCLTRSHSTRSAQDAPARFTVDVRQYEGSPYLVGPTVTVAPDGKVTASGRAVGTMPLGEWVRVEIVIALGEGTPGTYQLTLRGPGLAAEARELPYQSSNFREVHWLGISSSSEAAGTFYIDNLTDDDTPVDVLRFLDRRTGALPSCASFVTALDAAGAALLAHLVAHHLDGGGLAVAATHAPLGLPPDRVRALSLD